MVRAKRRKKWKIDIEIVEIVSHIHGCFNLGTIAFEYTDEYPTGEMAFSDSIAICYFHNLSNKKMSLASTAPRKTSDPISDPLKFQYEVLGIVLMLKSKSGTL